MVTPNTNISTGSIKSSFIKDAAVTTAKILDANVTTAKIADGSITAAKIADGTVVAAELADDAVVTAKILDANVTTAKIADDAVTLAKISTSGASDNQILVYDHSSTSIVWEDAAAGYTDAEAISAVEGEATLDLTGKASISNSAFIQSGGSVNLSPILHLVTDNTGWDKAHIILEDYNAPAIAIGGRNNTSAKNYQTAWTMDPEHNHPRTNVHIGNTVTAGSFVSGTTYKIQSVGTTDFTAIGSANNNVGTSFEATGAGSGTGTASMGNDTVYQGDYFYGFMKIYSDQDEIEMDMRVYGAHNGFNIKAFDDANGATWDGQASGNIGYQPKPIRLIGSTVTVPNKFIVGQDEGWGVGQGYNNLQITSSVDDADGYQVLQSVQQNSNTETQTFTSYDNGIKITPLFNELLGVTKLSTVHSVTDSTFFVDGMIAMHPDNGKPIYYKHTAGGASRSSAGWKYFSDDSEI